MATLPTVCKRPEPWIEQDFASLEKMVVFKYSEFGSFLGGKDQRSRLNNFFYFLSLAFLLLLKISTDDWTRIGHTGKYLSMIL